MHSVCIAWLLVSALALDDDLSLLQRRAVISADEVDEAVRQTRGEVQMSSDDDANDNEDSDGDDETGKCRQDKCYKSNGKMRLGKCSQKKCSGCAECPAPTPNPTPNPPAPNPFGNSNSNPFANNPTDTSPVVPNGKAVVIRNVYNPTGADEDDTFLDVCGDSENCASTSKYGVSTKTGHSNDADTTTLWQLVKVDSTSGEIHHGDIVHIISQYSTPTFLDTCGSASCTSGTQWGVCTNSGSRGPTSKWQVLKASGGSGAIRFGDHVLLKNLYKGGGYLDSCGEASCKSSTKMNVYTNTGVRGTTTQWKFR